MKKLLLLVPLTFSLGACVNSNQGTTTAAAGATGALIGAAVADDDDRLAGAALGGAAGIAAATLLGPSNTPGNCVYRDARGQRVIAPC
jgi:hypothetical protein